MKKRIIKSVFQIVILIKRIPQFLRYDGLFQFIIFFLFIGCQPDNSKQMHYRIGIVDVDSLILSGKTVLYKGNLVQVNLEKSTEEGTFIKTKNDSAKIYSKNITMLCWLKSGKIYHSLKDTISEEDNLILKRIENGKVYVETISGIEFGLAENDILFDNEKVYKSILE